MIKIGLTGPTGAGKSTVAAVFAAAGIPTVDADKAARAVTAPDSPVLQPLCKAFGADIVDPNGTLDRKLLAQRAFSSKEATARLNAITHPEIIRRMQAQLDAFEAAGEKAALIDAPLLFEAGLDSLCDLTVAVLADEEVRLARIMARDGVDREAALRRMAVQPKAAFYLSRANDILYNDGDPAQLEQQIAQLLEKIGRWCG